VLIDKMLHKCIGRAILWCEILEFLLIDIETHIFVCFAGVPCQKGGGQGQWNSVCHESAEEGNP
jgi:hypothetical protein